MAWVASRAILRVAGELFLKVSSARRAAELIRHLHHTRTRLVATVTWPVALGPARPVRELAIHRRVRRRACEADAGRRVGRRGPQPRPFGDSETCRGNETLEEVVVNGTWGSFQGRATEARAFCTLLMLNGMLLLARALLMLWARATADAESNLRACLQPSRRGLRPPLVPGDCWSKASRASQSLEKARGAALIATVKT